MRARAWLNEARDLVGTDLPVFTQAAFLTITLSLLSAFILSLPLTVGLYVMFLEKMRGEEPRLSHLWEGITEHFPASILIWIVVMLCNVPLDFGIHALLARPWPWSLLGLLAWLLGACLIATPLFFALPAIADRGLSARDAMRLSWQHVRPRLPSIFGLTVVYTLVRVVGLFGCGLGLILTLPIAVGAQVLAYRDLVGNLGAPPMTSIKYNNVNEVEGDEEG